MCIRMLTVRTMEGLHVVRVMICPGGLNVIRVVSQ